MIHQLLQLRFDKIAPVYTDVLFAIAVELVEGFQQGFILLAHAEVGRLHPLSVRDQLTTC